MKISIGTESLLSTLQNNTYFITNINKPISISEGFECRKADTDSANRIGYKIVLLNLASGRLVEAPSNKSYRDGINRKSKVFPLIIHK